MNQESFPVLILVGRPAAGKSEVIDYLKQTPVQERLRRFHIGPFAEIDDFMYVWQMFEEDAVRARYGKPRVYTDEKLYWLDPWIWNLLIEKINFAFQKRVKEDPEVLKNETTIVEFSRGGESGYREALEILDPRIRREAVLLYIDVSFEESLRKNRRRFNPERADSVLEHSVPDEKMEYYYSVDDFHRLAAASPTHLEIGDTRIPYTTLPNEPEVTLDPALLGPALEKAFGRLWEIRTGS
ncbi:MAG: hypothetical protein GF355_02420 [Candidatus Eisenbacteria bacterium]|nr:hypothetical protein [Candidatus Eisenbacteria bacterium]